MQSPLVNPLLMRTLINFFHSSCIIQRQITTRNSFGEQTITYEDDTSLRNIRCYVEGTGGESRMPRQIVVKGSFAIALNGYYPTIDVSAQALIDGIAYEIVDVQHDDTNTFTMLGAELVNQTSNV